jgi:hypothetical protein
MISIGLSRTTRNSNPTEREWRRRRRRWLEEVVALGGGFATMLDADRLIGGGAVGFLVWL